jgi:oligopeptide transport system substrate-binding protein
MAAGADRGRPLYSGPMSDRAAAPYASSSPSGGSAKRPAHRRAGRTVGAHLALATSVALVAVAIWPVPAAVRGADTDEVSISSGEPTSYDPAAQGDIGSAAVTAQIFEGLTAVDPGLSVRPALASSWDVSDGGRRIVFHLRPGLKFSDGSSLTAADVVRSWLRLIDPARPSPLASLILDVEGAPDYLRGRTRDPDTVGLRASGNDLEVRLSHPQAEFTSVVAGPSFGIVPAGPSPNGRIGSGGYVLADTSDSEITLRANDRYWAGRPTIRTVHLVTSLGGRSPVDAFDKGDLDYTGISSFDASWIAYDPDLGPHLRAVPSLSVEYLGFDVRQRPFDDVRVRRAFALAVDWPRLVRLASTGTDVPATSMVPPGVPGRSEGDFGQHADSAAARQLLADAGYPEGRGFPGVTYLSGGTGIDEGIVKQLHDNLGITIRYETMDFTPYFSRLAQDPPAIWSLGWTADYLGPNDFLGVLLGTDASNNYGHWSSAAFDQAITDAGAATDPAVVRAAYDRAEEIVLREVPVVPISYGSGWALSRTGLRGATQNGLGYLRMAGLTWAP